MWCLPTGRCLLSAQKKLVDKQHRSPETKQSVLVVGATAGTLRVKLCPNTDGLHHYCVSVPLSGTGVNRVLWGSFLRQCCSCPFPSCPAAAPGQMSSCVSFLSPTARNHSRLVTWKTAFQRCSHLLFFHLPWCLYHSFCRGFVITVTAVMLQTRDCCGWHRRWMALFKAFDTSSSDK